MDLILKIIFVMNFSLLLIHEMDAIRNKEWKMFIYLKDLEEEKAYRVFTLLHLPLYALFLMLFVEYFSKAQFGLYVFLDIFLIFHSIIHICFRGKSENKFKTSFSKWIIYGMGILAVLHILILILR